jgi:hypothetical protein
MPGKFHEYLGDAVYVSFDGYQLWLCTSNGLTITNKIALEPAVYENLLNFVKFLKGAKIEQADI